jgi:hypothetical protein
MAIIHPLKAKSTCTKERATIILLTVWLIAILTALPIIFGKEAQPISADHPNIFICIRIWSPNAWIIFEIYRLLIVLLIPLVITVFAYSKICYHLWKVPSNRIKLTQKSASSGGNNSISSKS